MHMVQTQTSSRHHVGKLGSIVASELAGKCYRERDLQRADELAVSSRLAWDGVGKKCFAEQVGEIRLVLSNNLNAYPMHLVTLHRRRTWSRTFNSAWEGRSVVGPALDALSFFCR